MNVKINSVRFSPSSKLEDFVEEKIKKLGQYSDNIIGAEVFLKLENTQDTDNKIAEIKVDIPGNEFFVKKQSKSFEQSTDNAVDAIKRQITRAKEKRRGL